MTKTWEIKPGDPLEVSPPIDFGDCWGTIFGQPTAANFALCPQELVGKIEGIPANRKLYIAGVTNSPATCPMCDTEGVMRVFHFVGFKTLKTIECWNCEQFSWVDLCAPKGVENDKSC